MEKVLKISAYKATITYPTLVRTTRHGNLQPGGRVLLQSTMVTINTTSIKLTLRVYVCLCVCVRACVSCGALTIKIINRQIL
jgi:hypothetical protein